MGVFLDPEMSSDPALIRKGPQDVSRTFPPILRVLIPFSTHFHGLRRVLQVFWMLFIIQGQFFALECPHAACTQPSSFSASGTDGRKEFTLAGDREATMW